MRLYLLFWILSVSTMLSVLQAANAQTAEDQKLSAFFDEQWEYSMKQNPVFASLLGDLRYNNLLPDVSLEAIKKDQTHDLSVLKQLQIIDRTKLSDANQLNYDLYLLNTQESIEGHKFPDYLMPINQMGGIQQQVPDTVGQLPFQNTKHYEDYVSRLNYFPLMMDQTLERLKEGLKRKITPPRITLRDVAEQIKAHATSTVENSVFYQPFKNFPESVSQTDQERLRKLGSEAVRTKVLPSYQKLYEFWTTEYFPNTREAIGLSALPDGKEWYAYNARVSTTTDLTPQQIHEIGLREVAKSDNH